MPLIDRLSVTLAILLLLLFFLFRMIFLDHQATFDDITFHVCVCFFLFCAAVPIDKTSLKRTLCFISVVIIILLNDFGVDPLLNNQYSNLNGRPMRFTSLIDTQSFYDLTLKLQISMLLIQALILTAIDKKIKIFKPKKKRAR